MVGGTCDDSSMFSTIGVGVEGGGAGSGSSIWFSVSCLMVSWTTMIVGSSILDGFGSLVVALK